MVGQAEIQLGDRTWRARDLARNASPEAMKVNLMVRRDEAFHVDGLDLMSAKARGAFVLEAAHELGLPPNAMKRDIGQVLLKLEGVQETMLRETAPAPGVVVSVGDEAVAMAWLRAPDLLDRIAADIATTGVVGEAENALTVYLAALSRKLDRPLAVLIQSTSMALGILAARGGNRFPGRDFDEMRQVDLRALQKDLYDHEVLRMPPERYRSVHVNLLAIV